MEGRALRLLVVAPTCDGQDVGEAWVAFQWARRLAARYQVTLLTYNKRGKQPASAQLGAARVIEWKEPALLGKAERWNSLLKPGYAPFFLRARHWIQKSLFLGERFDLAHQITPVGMRYPSPLLGLGIPYLLGPVGGSLESPKGFQTDGDTSPWYVSLRRFDVFRLRFDPLLRSTYERASCVIGVAPYVSDVLRGLSIRRLEYLSDTGIERLPPPVDRSTRTNPVRLLFVGRVIRTKGVRDAIRAMTMLCDLPVTFDIVGDGFDREACEKLAVEAGLAERVTFHGRKTHEEVQAFYKTADIFVFPSFREPGGTVVFEAMGWGLPLIVAQHGGPGAAVDETCGIRITAINPEQYAGEIAGAVRRLVNNRQLRRALGNGARLRAEKVALWDRKIESIDFLYREILNGTSA